MVTSAESYDVLVGGAVLYPMEFRMDYWTETAAYRPGWESGDERMSELPVRFISRDRPLGSSHAVLASIAGFSGVLTWLDDLLEGNRSAEDTPVYEELEEMVSLAASSLDVPLWGSCHALQQEADRLVKKAWSEVSLPAQAERVSGGRLVCGLSTLSPLVTTPIIWEYSPEGVCLQDLFGGISTGLAAVLESGILVRRYLYVEKDETARRVSSRHVTQLMHRFPFLLPRSAVRGYKKALPSDIHCWGRQTSIELDISIWILDVSRYSQVVRVADRSPMALVNHVGQPRMALPTLVSYPASHAYRDGGPRLLWDSTLHQLVEPNADERERAMRFLTVLCDKTLNDHRTTSRDHPEADGLAERMIQTVKRALRKYGLQKGHLGDWDIQLPWLAMGYRFSRQASLASFSPYFLLYGRDPDLPVAIRRESSEVLNLDDPDMWVRVCSQRAVLFRRDMPAAFENLAIAQHRDTLRYATIQRGGYRPSIRRFRVGDYVYLQQTAPTTLDVTGGCTILRVREVLPSGVLMLEGRDGVVWKYHVRSCAPCHLPNVDGTMDPSLAIVRAGLRCMLCGSTDQAAHMLVCDRCCRGWHMSCLTPPIDVVPIGRWVCPQCTSEGR
ncbi:hypothetical protein Mp_7g09570 [Marchantia polymorpha subsp. ruderalis]|uniref:PHD-type domain-containing protein n=2 Tax=Marchantia polymorpha TaxID=3197 RepID=A0AAF6BXT7_MARPO|nr:hypothetical protein MARPO_0068s0107 [Marchantia polymorpha]BBN16821.1 hypothetical protein Mp_7g09570 [Marchantia polymorpha subsp. ruderalis]|eukprot:PTQ35902.1 hypothetical protein MARPO_0068s0107 [Marchantia polymorpha]